MNFSKPVVAGIDFSPASACVLRHAAQTAASEDVPLFAVHVVDPAHLPHRPGEGPSGATLSAVLRTAKDRLTRLVELHAGGANVRPMVLSGRPAEQVRRLVDDEEAGLLVLSANDPSRKRLGSVACCCVRTAHCDVLLIRKQQDDRFRRVMACVDLSPSSGIVIGRAIEASRCGAALELVHVMYPPDRDCWGGLLELDRDARRLAEESRADTRQAIEQVTRGFVDELRPLSHATCILESPVPSVELTYHVDDTHADLVVLGTRGHSKLGGLFLDTNAERLLHDAPVSVLAVRI